jgi:hypothetical protein
MKRIFAVLCICVMCQSSALAAPRFKVGDRVFVPSMRKYGTVIPGGYSGPRGFNPNIRLDDAPPNATGGITLEPSSLRIAGKGAPPPPSVRVKSKGPTGVTGGGPGGFGIQTEARPNAAPYSVASVAPPQTQTPAQVSDPPVVDADLPSGNYLCYKVTGGGLAVAA